MKKISIITGVYNEAETVHAVYTEIKKIFSGLKDRYDYEHIFMDNCSTDETVSILKKIASQDKRVKILIYSKNFGAIKSEMMGYKYATGDAVIGYDASLKDPTSLIPVFIQHWENGFDVVYGIRKKTQDNLILSGMRKLFYRAMNILSDEKLPLDAGNFRLIDRKVVNELIAVDDDKPYIRGLISSIGFKQTGIPYERRARFKGRSKSTSKYLIDYAINGLINYTHVPIRLAAYSGLFLMSLSLIMAFLCLALRFHNSPISLEGLVLYIIIFFFFGISLFFLGIIGEYISAVHGQIKHKPFAIIKEKINF